MFFLIARGLLRGQCGHVPMMLSREQEPECLIVEFKGHLVYTQKCWWGKHVMWEIVFKVSNMLGMYSIWTIYLAT